MNEKTSPLPKLTKAQRIQNASVRTVESPNCTAVVFFVLTVFFSLLVLSSFVCFLCILI